jgi:hypothetical protein
MPMNDGSTETLAEDSVGVDVGVGSGVGFGVEVEGVLAVGVVTTGCEVAAGGVDLEQLANSKVKVNMSAGSHVVFVTPIALPS